MDLRVFRNHEANAMRFVVNIVFTLLLLIHCNSAAALQKQEQAALDALILATQTKRFETLAPHLSPQCRAKGVDAKVFARSIQQVIAGWPSPIVSHRLIAEADGGYQLIATRADGTERQYGLRFDKEGKFIELDLFSVKRMDTSALKWQGELVKNLPIRRAGNGLILVDASLDGIQGTWIIDSGAPMLSVNRKNQTASIGPKDVNGALVSGTDLITVNNFQLGSMHIDSFQAMSMDLSALEQAVGEKLAGLIGQRELAQFSADFNLPAKTLTLRAAGFDDPAQALAVLPFRMQAHLPVFTVNMTRAAPASKPLQMLFDTGAASNLLADKYWRHPSLTQSDESQSQLAGASAARTTVRTSVVNGFQVGDFALPAAHTVYTANAPLETDGMLGMRSIGERRFTLDYQRGELRIYPPSAAKPK